MSIEAFLQDGGSVCPFAKSTRRHYATVGEPLRNYRAIIITSARLFANTRGKSPPGAMLVIGQKDPDGFDLTKTWAREVFLELMVCFGILGTDRTGVPREESEPALSDHVHNLVRPILFDDGDPRRVVLSCNGDALYAICMSPTYPKTHPRYAPRTVVVVTWQNDVAEAFKLPAVDRIRAAMRHEHGSVYDADELMLPLPVPTSIRSTP